MLVVVDKTKNSVHTFDMPRVKKNKDGVWKPVEVKGQPVLEPQYFYETGKVENGMPIVARALAVNGTHALIYIKDEEKKETK